jgi:DNA-binding LytR/AlgR family response regulator
MKIIIIEDEKPAAEKLLQAIKSIDETVIIEAVLTSVEASVQWLQTHPMPELIFMDIELTDGLSFTIFDACTISCPVIFTTAYDEYWQEAFEHNSIDYLLKPVKQEKLEAALKKYHLLQQHFATNLKQLLHWQEQGKTEPKKRFLVKRGADLLSIKAEDIAYFYATHKLVCLVNFSDQKFLLDKSLADVEKETDPTQFYRVNRKYLVNVNAIKRMKAHQKGKLIVEVQPAVNEEIIVSQENASAFKEWIGS